jgi:endoglucanase
MNTPRLGQPRWSLLARLALVACALAGPALAGTAPTPMKDIDAWDAVKSMGLGINIGNTLDNPTNWETGWGNPQVSKGYIQALAAYGFKTVRLPVAWDSYARNGHISKDKLARVGEIVDWITAAGMHCVVNIHWDGGWINSGDKQRFGKDYATFTPEAERKFKDYWTQIATYFANRNELLVLEAMNEESNFEGEGSPEKAFATLAHVNQLFIDTVRATGGNNARRLLIISGYETDIDKTSGPLYVFPTDSVPHRLMMSVHYYTPSTFTILTEDASWGKMQSTWGSDADVAELTRLFNAMRDFCTRNDIPAFIGEFAVSGKKEPESRKRWMLAVARAAMARRMVPVLWEVGSDIQRGYPYYPDRTLRDTLVELLAPSAGQSH